MKELLEIAREDEAKKVVAKPVGLFAKLRSKT